MAQRLQIRRSESKDQVFVGYPMIDKNGSGLVIVKVFYSIPKAITYIEMIERAYHEDA